MLAEGNESRREFLNKLHRDNSILQSRSWQLTLASSSTCMTVDSYAMTLYFLWYCGSVMLHFVFNPISWRVLHTTIWQAAQWIQTNIRSLCSATYWHFSHFLSLKTGFREASLWPCYNGWRLVWLVRSPSWQTNFAFKDGLGVLKTYWLVAPEPASHSEDNKFWGVHWSSQIRITAALIHIKQQSPAAFIQEAGRIFFFLEVENPAASIRGRHSFHSKKYGIFTSFHTAMGTVTVYVVKMDEQLPCLCTHGKCFPKRSSWPSAWRRELPLKTTPCCLQNIWNHKFLRLHFDFVSVLSVTVPFVSACLSNRLSLCFLVAVCLCVCASRSVSLCSCVCVSACLHLSVCLSSVCLSRSVCLCIRPKGVIGMSLVSQAHYSLPHVVWNWAGQLNMAGPLGWGGLFLAWYSVQSCCFGSLV